MTEGIKAVEYLGVDTETMMKWVLMGVRTKKVSGRPVRDAMFDKLAMGSIKLLLETE